MIRPKPHAVSRRHLENDFFPLAAGARWLVLYCAEILSRWIGPIGLNVVVRILGLVLAAIAVEFIANGLRLLFPAPSSGRLGVVHRGRLPVARNVVGCRTLAGQGAHPFARYHHFHCRTVPKGNSPGRTREAAAPAGRFGACASALTLVGNSADTIVVLSALLADSAPAAEPIILLGCVGAAGVVAASSAYAVGHPRLARGIRTIAPTLTPLILLLVGCYILANTATDLLPG